MPVLAPAATAAEAACIPELAAFGARHLTDVVAHLAGGTTLAPAVPLEDAPLEARIAQREHGSTATGTRHREPDELDEVRRKRHAKSFHLLQLGMDLERQLREEDVTLWRDSLELRRELILADKTYSGTQFRQGLMNSMPSLDDSKGQTNTGISG